MSTDNANEKPVTSESLPDDPVVLKQMIAELLESLKASRLDAEQLQHRLDVLLRKMFGQRAERYDPHQPMLFAELAAALQGETPASVETPKEEPATKRKGH